jgi:hypothetical protein
VTTNPIIEVAFATNPGDPSPVWTNITQFVQCGGSNPITINRGASDELSTIQTGRMTLFLDNTDGRFTAGNPASPYYPNVVKNRRIRVRQSHVVTNYLTAPTFEVASDVAAWGTVGTAAPTLSQSAVRAHTGANSLLATWATGTGSGVWARAQGLQIGKTYTASVWVWVPSGGSPAVKLSILGGPIGSPSSTTNAWQQLTLTWTATQPWHDLQVLANAATTAGQQLWMDDASVNAGSSVVAFDGIGNYISPRFDGQVSGWPLTWPGGGKVSVVPVSASDITKPLDRAGTELRTLLQEEVLQDVPLAYYPLSEASGSTSAGDVSGGIAGALTIGQRGTGGTLTFGSSTGPPADGESCPTWTPADHNNGVYLGTDLGSAFETASTSQYITVEAWFSTSTAGGVILKLHSIGDDYQLLMYLDGTTGQLHVDTAQQGTIQVSTWPSANLADGKVHHVLYDEQTSTVWVDGTSLGTQTRLLMLGQRLLEIGGDPYDGMWSGGISHVALYAKGSLGSTRIVAHYNAGANGFAGESASLRISRILAYRGVTDVFSPGTLFDPIASQGAGGKTAMALCRDVETTEGGHLFARRDGGMIFQSRDVRYAQTAAVTLSAVDCEGDLSYTDDEQILTNYVKASRPGGAAIVAMNSASNTKYGKYSKTLNLLKTTDGEVVDAANWLITRYADPPARLPSLPVVANTLDTTTYRALLAADISTLIAVTNLPAQAPASTDTVCVEGYQERISQENHLLDFYCSPAALDWAWILDNATFAVLDATTKLAY